MNNAGSFLIVGIAALVSLGLLINWVVGSHKYNVGLFPHKDANHHD